jgi:hypothetical protein
MIPTPILNLTNTDYQHIYEPAGTFRNAINPGEEDTFLMLDALEKDEKWLLERKISLGLEIGYKEATGD